MTLTLHGRRVLASLCLSVAAHGGILVTRTGDTLQFAEAISITVNGKDKVTSLGERPVVTGQLSKLPSVHVGGVVLQDKDTGVLARLEGGKVEYLVPQNLAKGAPTDPAGMWKASKVLYKKSASDKVLGEVAAPAFVAYLPGGLDELTRLCRDTTALQLIGGKDKAFPVQIELISAVVKLFANDPGIAPLDRYVADSMRKRYEEFEGGAAGLDVLMQGLKFVELSQAAYPKSPEQEKLRRQLLDRKVWLDRRIAVLKAFAAGAQWDAFLLGNRDFERYLKAYPEMAAQQTKAMQESLQMHLKTAARQKEDGDYGGAFREYRLAGMRRPSDPTLHEEAMQAWTEYSRRIAADRQSRRTRLSAGPQNTIERNLYFADQNKAAKNLDEALKNVLDAESVLEKSQPADAVTPEALKVRFKKAEILGAQDRITEALTALDGYDLDAVDDERLAADKLRNQLLFNLNTTLKNLKGRLQKAWTDGRYFQTRQLAAEGLKMKADDPDLLYYSGMAALIARQGKESREALARYLELSNTLEANQEQRANARRLLSGVRELPAATAGDANWLSGRRLPKDAFYCPLSLAFQPHVDRIEASNKLRLLFEWDGEKLRSVTPSFEKNDRVTSERKISFGYKDRVPQVVWASDDNEARPAATADPDDAYQKASVLLLNYPIVDPTAIQRVTGKNAAVGIAGNKFFNPFVWEKLYYFRLTYDDAGRVSRAQELTARNGAPGEQALEFEWDGNRLMAVRGYIGKAKNYERTMQYQEGRLMSEEVQWQGKQSHIKYVYNGGRLVSAEAGNDLSADGRSRKIAFAANSPSTVK